MNLQGKLDEIGVPGVIDLALQMNKPVAIALELADGKQGRIYLAEGQVLHAEFDEQEGMEALYRLFKVEEGNFELLAEARAPRRTLEEDWNAILLEILHRLDEETAQEEPPAPPAASSAHARIRALQALLEEADLDGAAVVGRDGLTLAAHLPVRGLDEDLLGAMAASIFALSDRSVQQLKRGNFLQTMVQGEEGNLIVTRVNQDILLVGVVSADTSLGMAFAETRMLAGKIAEQLAIP